MSNDNQAEGQQEKLYRWVKASERMPDLPGEYFIRYTSGRFNWQKTTAIRKKGDDETFFCKGDSKFHLEDSGKHSEWLEEVPTHAVSEGKEVSIEELEKERMEWSFRVFPQATALSSLAKLNEEMIEVAHELQHGHAGEDLAEEYADCLMCLFDSAGRAGITPKTLFSSFASKLEKNKNRTWTKNPDNTYSHNKQ